MAFYHLCFSCRLLGTWAAELLQDDPFPSFAEEKVESAPAAAAAGWLTRPREVEVSREGIVGLQFPWMGFLDYMTLQHKSRIDHSWIQIII